MVKEETGQGEEMRERQGQRLATWRYGDMEGEKKKRPEGKSKGYQLLGFSARKPIRALQGPPPHTTRASPCLPPCIPPGWAREKQRGKSFVTTFLVHTSMDVLPAIIVENLFHALKVELREVKKQSDWSSRKKHA